VKLNRQPNDVNKQAIRCKATIKASFDGDIRMNQRFTTACINKGERPETLCHFFE